MSRAHTQNAKGIDVGYVAHLARLHLSDDETARLQKQLDHILAYVDELRKVDVEGVAPMSHPVAMNAPLRDDAVKPSLDHDAVLGNAPDGKNGQFSVPQIIE